jgi:hypothetical protein
MAAVATRRKEKTCTTKKKRTHLTPTALLMEGHYVQNPCRGHFERNDSWLLKNSFLMKFAKMKLRQDTLQTTILIF